MQHNEIANGGHGLPMASQRRIKAALDAGEDLAAFLGIAHLNQDQERIAAILMERWSKRRRKAQIE